MALLKKLIGLLSANTSNRKYYALQTLCLWSIIPAEADVDYTLFGIISFLFSIFVPEKVYFMGSLSAHIKQKRKKYGLSQVELAQRAGVGLRFVRDLEQGKQTLRMDKVNDVLALFGDVLGPVKINEQ